MTRGGTRAALLAIAAMGAGCAAPAETPQETASVEGRAAPAPGACALERSDGGRTAALEPGCPRTGAAVAAALRADGKLAGVRDVALGKTPFAADGVFDRCAVLARLARDPRWTATIDSVAAVPVLKAALSAEGPVAAVQGAIGRPIERVGVEMVMLGREAADRGGCPQAPAVVPVSAMTWLVME